MQPIGSFPVPVRNAPDLNVYKIEEDRILVGVEGFGTEWCEITHTYWHEDCYGPDLGGRLQPSFHWQGNTFTLILMDVHET